MAEVFRFPTDNVNLGDAVVIVKRCLDDDSIPFASKKIAIEKVAQIETHNSITKDELVDCLRWLFDHYDCEGAIGT